VIVRQGDSLFAVIHGYGKDGWHGPLTSQTYLLKDSFGDGLKTQSAEEASNASESKGALPQQRGDVIRRLWRVRSDSSTGRARSMHGLARLVINPRWLPEAAADLFSIRRTQYQQKFSLNGVWRQTYTMRAA